MDNKKVAMNIPMLIIDKSCDDEELFNTYNRAFADSEYGESPIYTDFSICSSWSTSASLTPRSFYNLDNFKL